MDASHPVGVLPVFQTPFDRHGMVDLRELETELAWIIDQGASGVVMAMVSEVLRLASDERDKVAAEVCRIAGPLGVVVISVGSESTEIAVRHALATQDAGADAIMATPPVALGALPGEMLQYYEALARAVELPIIVQDASSYVGMPMSTDFQRKLLHEFGPRISFKPESQPIGPRISALRDATDGAARILYGGPGIHLIDTHRRGIVGVISAADVCWAIVALWEALERGDDARAYAIGGPLAMLSALQVGLDGYVSIEKYLLKKQGVLQSARTRGPRGFLLDAETCREVDRLYELLRDAVGKRSTATEALQEAGSPVTTGD